jgi:hypothetical protein
MTKICIYLKFAVKMMVAFTMVLALTKPLLYGQGTNALKWKLNDDGTRYFQMTFLNQPGSGTTSTIQALQLKVRK